MKAKLDVTAIQGGLETSFSKELPLGCLHHHISNKARSFAGQNSRATTEESACTCISVLPIPVIADQRAAVRVFLSLKI